MALPLGKLTILVGAGIVGSVLAKEGRMSNVSDFFSGAVKIVWKQLRQDNSTPSSVNVKPRNDSLLAQVNSLRQELQLLASNRPVTIITTSASGSRRYGIIIVIVVVGYGYVWWKGWRLPDMMFATRRSLSNACNAVAKQLDNVYSSISVTKRHLSSKIDRVDSSLDECAEVTATTREEVSELRGEMKNVGVTVRSVHHTVRSLESRIGQMEWKKDLALEGVKRLVGVVSSLENSRTIDHIQAAPSSSRQALELPQMTPSSRTVSLPPTPSAPSPSPFASNGSHKVHRQLQTAVSASGLKVLHEISDVSESSNSPTVSNGVHQTEDTDSTHSSSGLFGQKIPSRSASFFSRTRSAILSFKPI